MGQICNTAIPACASCHGENGDNTYFSGPMRPIAGMDEYELEDILFDYADGKRQEETRIMSAIGKAITPEEVTAIGKYLSTLQQQYPITYPKKSASAIKESKSKRKKREYDLGKKIYNEGIPNVRACKNCHGEFGQGVEKGITTDRASLEWGPAISKEYGVSTLEIILKDYLSRKRRYTSKGKMIFNMDALSERQIRAVSVYTASLVKPQ